MFTCRCHANQATQKASASFGLFLTLANYLSFAINSIFSAVSCILDFSACSLSCAGSSLHCMHWDAFITLPFVVTKLYWVVKHQQRSKALLRQRSVYKPHAPLKS